MDLATRSPAPAELRRFGQRFGAAALIDVGSRAYNEAGLAYMRLDDDEIMQRLLAEPRLLRLPLVRAGADLAVGPDEAAWRGLLGRVMP